jgi:hypothetical protein
MTTPGSARAVARLSAQPTEFRVGAARWMSRTVHDLSRLIEPFLGEIRTEALADVPDPRVQQPAICQEDKRRSAAEGVASVDPDGPSILFRPLAVTAQLTVQLDDVLEWKVNDFVGQVFEIAQEFASQLMKGLFQHLSDVSDAYGHTVSASEQGFWEALIQAAGRLDFNFDEQGNPDGMFVAVHPDTWAKMQKNPPTADQEHRLNEVIEKKRGEWLAARRRRPLPGLAD